MAFGSARPWQPLSGNGASTQRDSPANPLPPALAEVDGIYLALNELGWADVEIDGLEIWRVARLLGVGDDRDHAVIRGTRSIDFKADDDGPRSGTGGKFTDPHLAERIARSRQARDGG